MQFADINTAWAVGTNGTILKTTDTGITWTNQPSGTLNDLYSVHYNSVTRDGYLEIAEQFLKLQMVV